MKLISFCKLEEAQMSPEAWLVISRKIDSAWGPNGFAITYYIPFTKKIRKIIDPVTFETKNSLTRLRGRIGVRKWRGTGPVLWSLIQVPVQI